LAGELGMIYVLLDEDAAEPGVCAPGFAPGRPEMLVDDDDAVVVVVVVKD
jgi:hypothetical protein